MRKKTNYLWIVLLLTLCHPDGRSEVNWRLQAGGMYERPYELGFLEEDGKLGHKSSFNAGGGLYLQIPLGKTSPLYIETGLGYLYKPQLSVSEEFDFTPANFVDKWPESSNSVDYGMVSILEIPVKFGYALRVNDVSQLEFGAGPYVSSAVSYEFGDTWGVGMTVSAAYRYKKMSYGISWENPVFYNGPRDHYRNTFQVTIGLNFGLGAMRNWDWDAIAATAGAIGNSLESVSAAYMEMQVGEYSSGGEYVSGASGGSGSGNYQQDYDTWVNRAKGIIEGTGGHSMSASTLNARKRLLRDAQKQMKRIRDKARKAGVTVLKSEYETADLRAF